MLFKSQVYTQASGSVGGLTYSHNRGGMYTRGRSIPVNPNSSEQQTVRAVFGSLAQRWTNILTQQQRDGWENYAALTPVTNRLGDELLLSGQQMYIRCNTVRVQASVAEVDDGPTTPGNASLTTITLSSSGLTVSVNYDNTDPWAILDGGGLNVQSGRGQSATINYFKGPFRFAAVVLGNTATPPTHSETTGSKINVDTFVSARSKPTAASVLSRSTALFWPIDSPIRRLDVFSRS
jgi:hypothetical protein